MSINTLPGLLTMTLVALLAGPVRGAEEPPATVPVNPELGLLSCSDEVVAAGCRLIWTQGSALRSAYALESLTPSGRGSRLGRIVPEADGTLPAATRYDWRLVATAGADGQLRDHMRSPGLYRVLGCDAYTKRDGGTNCESSLAFWLPEKPPLASLPNELALADSADAWSYAAIDKKTTPEAMYAQYNTYLVTNLILHAASIDGLPPLFPPHGNPDFLYAVELDHIIHHNIYSTYTALIEHRQGGAP